MCGHNLQLCNLKTAKQENNASDAKPVTTDCYNIIKDARHSLHACILVCKMPRLNKTKLKDTDNLSHSDHALDLLYTNKHCIFVVLMPLESFITAHMTNMPESYVITIKLNIYRKHFHVKTL